MNTDLQDIFLHLVRLGIGAESEPVGLEGIDCQALQQLSEEQGLSGVAVDGVGKIPKENRPPRRDIMPLIGSVMVLEDKYAVHQKAASKMAQLFHSNGIRTYVLKGAVAAECYPKPEHRASVDMDCFLLPDTSDFDAWKLGNDLIKARGYEVDFDYYKNSTFYLPGLAVENHQYLTPFRGNKRLTALEEELQAMIRQDGGEDRFADTWLYRPPVMVSALFLIEHAYSHFLHEGLTWRLVLDWMMFSQRHRDEIDWAVLEAKIDEYGFRKFYDSYLRLGRFLMGELGEDGLSQNDRRMLSDIWAPLDLHEDVHGLGGKLALAGNTFRARWKYRHFTDITWLQALWIQVKGVVFEREPKL